MRPRSILMGSSILVMPADRLTVGRKRAKASSLPLSAISTLAFSALIFELLAMAMSSASCKESAVALAATQPLRIKAKYRFITTIIIQKDVNSSNSKTAQSTQVIKKVPTKCRNFWLKIQKRPFSGLFSLVYLPGVGALTSQAV